MGRLTLEKHTPYFTVLEAFQTARDCALCGLEKKAVHSYFDAFLFENVNDPSARDGLRASHGYCPYHTHFLVGFHDPLALSILYKEQTLLAAAFMEKHKTSKNLLADWEKHKMCPACHQALEIRRHYVGILVDGLADMEMREVLLGHFHVCLNHLLMVLDALRDDVLKKELIEKMHQRLASLAENLEQYCQDSQKNAVGEVFDSPHSYAWKEAVEVAVGQRDVFEPLL